MIRSRTELAGLTGFCVEFGWIVGESVMIPHMLDGPLDQNASTAGFLVAVNPLLTLILAPFIGSHGDGGETRHERNMGRRTSLCALVSGAILGLFVLVLSPYCAARRTQVALCFVAFGLADMCHDLILVPGRSLVVSMSSASPEDEGHADAQYSTLQMIGRLAGTLTITMIPEQRGLWGLSHFQASWCASIVVTLACAAVAMAVTAPKRKETVGLEEEAPSDQSLYVAVHAAREFEDDEEEPEEEALESLKANRRRRRRSLPGSAALYLFLAMNLCGWIALLTPMFWLTTWLGLDNMWNDFSLPLVASAALTVVGALVSAFLPHINRAFSEVQTFAVSEVFMMTVLIALRFAGGSERPRLTIALVGLLGGPYAIHTSNAHLIGRAIVDEAHMLSRVVALVSNTMTLAQILVGSLAGIFVNCPNDPSRQCTSVASNLFFKVGCIALTIDLLLIASDAFIFKSGLFFGDSDDDDDDDDETPTTAPSRSRIALVTLPIISPPPLAQIPPGPLVAPPQSLLAAVRVSNPLSTAPDQPLKKKGLLAAATVAVTTAVRRPTTTTPLMGPPRAPPKPVFETRGRAAAAPIRTASQRAILDRRQPPSHNYKPPKNDDENKK